MISRKRKKTFKKKTFRNKTFRKKTFRKNKNIKRKILKGGVENQQQINKELYQALITNDITNVKRLIDLGADPNSEVDHHVFGPAKPIDIFRITLQNPFNDKWVQINDFLKSKNI